MENKTYEIKHKEQPVFDHQLIFDKGNQDTKEFTHYFNKTLAKDIIIKFICDPILLCTLIMTKILQFLNEPIGFDDLLETELKNAARRQNDNLRKRRKKNAPLLSCKKPKRNKIYSGA